VTDHNKIGNIIREISAGRDRVEFRGVESELRTSSLSENNVGNGDFVEVGDGVVFHHEDTIIGLIVIIFLAHVHVIDFEASNLSKIGFIFGNWDVGPDFGLV